jgi:putative transposase
MLSFVSTHDQVANRFIHSRYNRDAAAKRAARTQACAAWGRASGARTFGVTAV